MLIRGERTTIQTTTPEDLSDLVALRNDGRVMQWVGFPSGLGYDINKISKWFAKLRSQPHRHHFIVSAGGIRFCGEVYYEVDKERQRAGLDIKFRPEAHGQGLATDALKTLIRHVFETEKDVQVIWTEPREENADSKKLYAHCCLEPKPRPPDMEPLESYWELSREKWVASSDR